VACPYRLDVPSGVWSFDEYEKLRAYDEPTGDQPWMPFACHATPNQMCNGWAVCHTSRGNEHDLLALRIVGYPAIPTSKVPLHASGNDAADFGQEDIDDPSDEAMAMVDKLMERHERLRDVG
jgi:hypothetical protein